MCRFVLLIAIVALTLSSNVSAQPQPVSYAATDLGADAGAWRDLLSKREVAAADGALALRLRPYDVLWLEPV